MKKDLNDFKLLVFELISINDLEMFVGGMSNYLLLFEGCMSINGLVVFLMENCFFWEVEYSVFFYFVDIYQEEEGYEFIIFSLD